MSTKINYYDLDEDIKKIIREQYYEYKSILKEGHENYLPFKDWLTRQGYLNG